MRPVEAVGRRLLVTYPLDSSNRKKLEDELGDWQIRYDGRTPAMDALTWAEVIFGNVVPATMILDAPGLEWLHSPSAGVDAYEAVVHHTAAQITNVVGLYNDSVAEHALMFILMALRHELQMVRAQKEGKWIQPEIFASPPRLLRGASIHVLGYGQIARCLIDKLEALGAVVTAYRRNINGTEKHRSVLPIERLIESVGDADVLVCLLPGGADTKDLVNASVLERLRADAAFVNLGRGSTVDESALAHALEIGRLRVAGLDVFANEPLAADSPLWALENVIISPHVGGRFIGDTELQCAEFVRLLREAGR